jgi:phage terminase large subunit
MISIDSDGVESIDALRSELCSIPAKDNSNGLIQIMNKKEMKTNGIDSPNMADSIMMCLYTPDIQNKPIDIKALHIPTVNHW